MSVKERGQNPVVGDQLNLRLFSWDSNNKTSVYAIPQVQVYYLDPNGKTEENPDGRTLVQTFTSADSPQSIIQDDTGEYHVEPTLQSTQYVIGDYLDVWTVQVQDTDTNYMTWTNKFKVYPNLFFMSTHPLVYDFSFWFEPNKIRLGSKRWLIIHIKPNVPHASDLERYYMNLAISSPLNIYMVQTCGECLPQNQDERTAIDGDLVTYREKCVAYYFLDTSELNEGIYDVWFEMTFADSVYISDRQQLQLY